MLLLSSTPIVARPLPWSAAAALLPLWARLVGGAVGGRRDLLDLGVRGRGEGEDGAGDGPVGDLFGGEFDHRRRARRGVDRRAQRRAVRGVEGELGAAEQAATFLRGDPHRVGGPAGHVGRLCAGQLACAPMCVMASSICATVGGWPDRARRVRRSSRTCRRRGRVAVEGVGGGVVDRDAVAVVEHLGVALFGLQLEAQRGRRWTHSRPDAPAISGTRCEFSGWPLAPLARLAPSSRRLVNWMRRSRPGPGAGHARRGRPGRAAWQAAWGRADGGGDRRDRDPRPRDGGTQQQQTREGDTAEDVHCGPTSLGFACPMTQSSAELAAG